MNTTTRNGPRRRWLIIAFALAALVTMALGARLITRAAYWSSHQDVAIEGWMTVGYVARSRAIEPVDLIKALGPIYTIGDRRALKTLSEARGVPLDTLIRELKAGIAKARKVRPMTDAALALALDGGPFALAIVLALAAIGIPLPATFALLAMGALMMSAQLDVLQTLCFAAIGSITGDQIGYWIGRFGGDAISRRFGARLNPARRFVDRHGLLGVFLSRFLFTPLGPPINVVAGTRGMAWWRFSLAGVTGEIVWVLAFMGLGALFADRVAALADLAGTFAWFLVAGAVTIALGVALWRRRGTR